MKLNYCKKSVFCVLFFFYYFAGTICGVLLFHVASAQHNSWLYDYLQMINDQKRSLGTIVMLYAKPLLVLGAALFVPYGVKFVGIAILLRGCMAAYTFSALYMMDFFMPELLLHEAILMVVYFMVLIHFGNRSGKRSAE